jgi:leucyl/phenylalanyl-tRNA--protein transferase
MPIFLLDENISFPEPRFANKEGLIAIGGDLTPERLIKAYSMGIFPWYSSESPILWWSPDPRMVLFPEEFKVSKSLRLLIQKNIFTVKFDHNFREVIRSCAAIPRKDQEGTWITEEMIEAYCHLHEAGYAHSVESYYDGKLVGGLYGVSLGRAFFGESMFHIMTDASKAAFYFLIMQLREWQFHIVDAQQKTKHLRSLGGRTIPRDEFLHSLEIALGHQTYNGNWQQLISLHPENQNNK